MDISFISTLGEHQTLFQIIIFDTVVYCSHDHSHKITYKT